MILFKLEECGVLIGMQITMNADILGAEHQP